MQLTQQQVADLSIIRQSLHAEPEISGNEIHTAQKIAILLDACQPDAIMTGLGGTGVAAVFDSGKPGKTVMVRCELDGLPIHEISTLSYRSTVDGKGHQCGHDGHMAIALGVARLLHKQRSASGRAVLLFQPAEETGKGARAIMSDPRYGDISPDYALSLHNLPGFDRHQIILKEGGVNCASRGIRIALTGKTAHASMPETGTSPALALAQVIEQLHGLSNPTFTDTEFRLVTLVHAHMGERAFGVSPAEAEIWATLRTISDAGMQQLTEAAQRLADRIAAEHGLVLKLTYDDVFNACDNHSNIVAHYRQCANDLGFATRYLDEPLRFSEDFGEYGKSSQAAMFYLGAGHDQPALHNPDYDFPDELIQTGTSMFYAMINRLI